MLGHKADLGFMALGPDLWRLRRLQTDLQVAGLMVADSYVSLTEVSEYSAGDPRRDEADPAVSHAAAGGDDRVLLLPDVQAAGGRRGLQLVLPALRGAQGHHARARRRRAGPSPAGSSS